MQNILVRSPDKRTAFEMSNELTSEKASTKETLDAKNITTELLNELETLALSEESIKPSKLKAIVDETKAKLDSTTTVGDKMALYSEFDDWIDPQDDDLEITSLKFKNNDENFS